ncbi:hypothetical protein TDB9533_00038 [Thalassocella blandensis]|nr:hypothetical protein TDB9533_00038 [Thalassocella blandensis]
MSLNVDKISAAIETARKGGPVYCEIDSRMKCEICFVENKLRLIVCLYRAAQRFGQLQSIAKLRHKLPDQYASMKIGTDSHLNMYASKTITYIAPMQAMKEVENVCELLTQ